MLGVNVLEHCVSGERSRVPNVSGKVLNTLCVSTSKTDEGRTLLPLPIRYMTREYAMLAVFNVTRITFQLIVTLFRCGTNALSAGLR